MVGMEPRVLPAPGAAIRGDKAAPLDGVLDALMRPAGVAVRGPPALVLLPALDLATRHKALQKSAGVAIINNARENSTLAILGAIGGLSERRLILESVIGALRFASVARLGVA